MRSIIIFLSIILLSTMTSGLEYILALERCDDAPSGNYTIHGLWPQFNESSWPQYCNKSAKFDYSALNPIMSQIDKWWQTCTEFNHTEEWFLQHEWIKHGSCTPFTEIQYFSTALALYQILPWNATCVPDDNQCLLEITSVLSI